mgnify:CR=1 FL=1
MEEEILKIAEKIFPYCENYSFDEKRQIIVYGEAIRPGGRNLDKVFEIKLFDLLRLNKTK